VPVDGEAEPPGSVPTQSMGTKFRLWWVPDIPPHFLDRTNELEGLRQKVLGDAGSVGIFGLQGMGGIGKTVLANALARDPQVQARFPDGVYWVTVGIEPMLTRQQGRLAEAVNGEKPSITDVQQGKECLRQCFAGKQALLILDDLWNAADAKAFTALDEGSRLLLTTRDREILTVLGAEEHRLGLLAEPQALELLAEWSGRTLDDLGEDGRRVAEECGYLPLALSITGAMLKGQPDKRWSNVLKRLQNADLDKIKRQFPDYPYPDLLKALQVSVDALEPDLQERYLDLAVFPEDTPIPETVIETFWEPEGLDDLDTDEILAALADKSLLQRGEDGVLLHDLQYDYITKQVADLPTLHQRLLDAYGDKCDDGWPSGPNDGYYFQQLTYHFAGAKREPELQELLLNFAWLQAKLTATEVNSLINDYDYLPDDQDLALVKATLRLSAHILRKAPRQLRERLWGHLRHESSCAIQNLLGQALKQDGAWLCPQQASLTSPSGPLLRTIDLSGELRSPTGGILPPVAAISPDGRIAVSTSKSKVKVWDIQKGIELHNLSGHSDSSNDSQSGVKSSKAFRLIIDSLQGFKVTSVVIFPNGSLALSAASDGTLKVWDLEKGVEIKTLKGHLDSVQSVAISPDGHLAVSASNDRTLKIWDLRKGVEIETLKGHLDSVQSVAISPDGHLAISASDDRTLKVWDLRKGVEIKTLKGHLDSVQSVAISPDGHLAISASDDRTLKVWDLRRGIEIKTLEGHCEALQSVAVLPIDTTLAKSSKFLVASASLDHTIRLWNIEHGLELAVIEGHSAPVRSVAVSSNGKRLISISDDETLKIWNLQQNDKLYTLARHAASVWSLGISQKGNWAISGSADETVKVWDLKRAEELRTLHGHKSWVTTLAISANGDRAVSASDDGELKVWDLIRGAELYTLQGHRDFVRSLTVLPDGNFAISKGDDRLLKKWDLRQGQEVYTLNLNSVDEKFFRTSGNGKRAISISGDRSLNVWDLDSGKSLYTLIDQSGKITFAEISPYGDIAISVSSNQVLKVWDLEQRRLLHILEGHRTRAKAIFFTPAGDVAVSIARKIKVWDIKRGIELCTLKESRDFVWSRAFSKTGQLMVSASEDRKLRVWDLVVGQCIATFWGDSPFYACAVAPDGVTIVAGDQAGVVHFFRLEGVDAP
jgi:WD40 repeat protein